MMFTQRRSLTLVIGVALLVSSTLQLSTTGSGQALGDIEAVWPQSVAGVGEDFEQFSPSMSRRGEAIVATEWLEGEFSVGQVRAQERVNNVAPDSEPGESIGISGDGCTAVSVRHQLQYSAPVRSLLLARDICTSGSADVFLLELAQGGDSEFDFISRPAVDFSGQRAVVTTPLRVVVVDVVPGGGNVRPLRLPEGLTPLEAVRRTDPVVDISADGRVVAAALEIRGQFGSESIYSWTVDSPAAVFEAGRAVHPSLSGDGSFLAYDSRNRPGAPVSPEPIVPPVVTTTTTTTPDPPDPPDPPIIGLTFLSKRRGTRAQTWVYVTPRGALSPVLLSPEPDTSGSPSISEDGTQVAFVHQAPCITPCPPPNASVVRSSTPGLASGQVVELIATGTTYDSVELSGNGHTVAWTAQRTSGDGVFRRTRDAAFDVTGADFGAVAIGGSVDRTVTVTNTGPTSILPASISVTDERFSVTGGTCQTDRPLAVAASFAWIEPGTNCTIAVRLTGAAPTGSVSAQIVVAEAGFAALEARGTLRAVVEVPGRTPPDATTTTSTTTTGTTTGTTTTAPPTPQVELSAAPNPLEFGDVFVGVASDTEDVTVTNGGDAGGPITVTVGGAHPDDYEIVSSDGCTTAALAPGASCTIRVRLKATAAGGRTATLVIASGAVNVGVPMTGNATFDPMLRVSPAALTEREIMTVIGSGFQPDDVVGLVVDPIGLSLQATAGFDGTFRIQVPLVGRIPLGDYNLRSLTVADVSPEATTKFAVVLGTFNPQGPTGPAFSDNLFVTRG